MKTVLAATFLCCVLSASAWAPATLTQSKPPRNSLSPLNVQVHQSMHNSATSTTLRAFPPQAFTMADVVAPSDDYNIGLKNAVKAIQQEAKMTFGVVQSDLPVTVVLGTVSAIAFGLARPDGLSSMEWMSLVVKSVAWFFGYGYHYNIGNQMDGIEEDKLNLEEFSFKSNRPLATGEMTMEQAEIRHILSGICYLGLSWFMGGTELSLCALLWIISSQCANFWGWNNHFITKNWVIMSTGSISMLLGARAIAGETAASVIPPVLAATWIGLCMDSQDLRDEVGDRESGRQTTAVMFGVEKARQMYVAQASVVTGLLMYLVKDCIAWPDVMVVAGIVAHLVRTLTSNKTAKDDHLTYKEICLAGFCFFCRSAFWAQTF